MVANFIINPNVAYLLLVSGFLLAVMAILTPGTGFLELGAFFALVLAGWEVYQLPVNWWALGLLLIGVLPFMVAVRRSGNLLYLGLSILALVVGSAFMFQGEGLQPAVSPLLALVVSTLSAGFMWIATVKTLEAQRIRPSHDLGALIGSVGTAKTNIFQEGSVFVGREEWSATSEVPIPEGTKVRVLKRDGFILHVEPTESLDRNETELNEQMA